MQEFSGKILWDGGLARLAKYLRLFRSRDRDYHSFVIWFFFLAGLNKMAAQVQMRAAFMRCGVNQPTADYIMEMQGYDTPEELAMASQDDFDSMIKNAIKSSPPDVNFASVAIRKLNTFKYWTEERTMCGLPITANLFTADIRRWRVLHVINLVRVPVFF